MQMHIKTNFRPAFPPAPKAGQPVAVFRGANPDNWSHEDLLQLINEHKVKTILDLRFPTEMSSSTPGLYMHHFEERVHNSLFTRPNFAPSNGRPTRYLLGMTTLQSYLIMLRSMRVVHMFWLLWEFLRYYLLGKANVQSYAFLHCPEMRTIQDMYRLLLEGGKSTMKEMFLLLRHRSQYPVMVACMQGKDRTGMLCMLIQDLMQCSEEEIEVNYALSEKTYSGAIKEALNRAFLAVGIPVEFARCDRPVMHEFRKYFKAQYQTAENYLRHIGLTQRDIEDIKTNLALCTSSQ